VAAGGGGIVTLGLFDAAFVGGLVGSAYDADAEAYLTAVETADGQALETAVRDAINAFVVGCKADGIWNAIKASCIMAGARTLAGALVPLVGAAPTNFNFVAGDYNRKTGLVGNGSTKYLDSNRNSNADPQDSQHLTVYISQAHTSICAFAGAAEGVDGTSQLIGLTSPLSLQSRSRSTTAITSSTLASVVGLFGISRNNATTYSIRGGAGSYIGTLSVTSVLPVSSAIHIFRRATIPFPTNARLSFYSIGESLNLALLDARVTTLMNALAVAIP
jgi:hypothetical protein